MGPRVVTPLSISATPRRPAPLLGLQGPAASGCLHACATSSTDQGAYGLVGGEELIDAGTWPKASVAEPLRDQLLQLCRQRLDAFRMQRGEEVGCLLTQKLRLRAQEPPPHADQRLAQSPGMEPMGWRCTSRNGMRWWSWFIR
jgi:hypothetical protein